MLEGHELRSAHRPLLVQLGESELDQLLGPDRVAGQQLGRAQQKWALLIHDPRVRGVGRL